MHSDPSVEFHLESVGQQAHKVDVAPGQRDLAYADAAAGANQRELAYIAIGA